MIADILGRVIAVNPTEIVLRTGDIGYSIVRPIHDTNGNLAQCGRDVSYWIYHHFTEKSQVLFGFNTYDSRRLALELMDVDGIGAKTAHRLATAVDAAVVIAAVANGDVAALAKITKGFGPTGAKKLVDSLQVRFQSRENLQYDQTTSAVYAILSALGLGARFDIGEIKDAVLSNPGRDANFIAQSLIGKARK